MKTIINLGMWKGTLSPSGKLEVVINGTDKKFTVQLTNEEQEQVAFRIAEGSSGMMAFDPAPQDLVGRHSADLITLEEQSTTITDLRETLEAGKSAFTSLSKEYEEFKAEHADADEALGKLRDKNKHLTLDLHEANGKILELQNKLDEITKPANPIPTQPEVS
jgi:predicted RNase H-like nuclease (RuvC/YqgF family)